MDEFLPTILIITGFSFVPLKSYRKYLQREIENQYKKGMKETTPENKPCKFFGASNRKKFF